MDHERQDSLVSKADKGKNMRISHTTFLCTIFCAIFTYTAGAGTSFAAPHPPLHRPIFKHGHPDFRLPPPRHFAHHPGPRFHHGSDWFVPLAFTSFAAGLTAAALTAQSSDNIHSTPAVTTPSSSDTHSNSRFWCEAEKGYYPDVRACPTGWTAVPAK